MIYLIEGEVVDTYGGDYTYRDVWYEEDDLPVYNFYERYYGAKPSEVCKIDDENEIEELLKQVNE